MQAHLRVVAAGSPSFSSRTPRPPEGSAATAVESRLCLVPSAALRSGSVQLNSSGRKAPRRRSVPPWELVELQRRGRQR
eukprot:s1012_g12.t1